MTSCNSDPLCPAAAHGLVKRLSGGDRRPAPAAPAIALSILALVCVSAVSATGAAQPLAVQDNRREPEDERELEQYSLERLLSVQVPTVESVSRRSEKATDAPATVVVLSEQEIRLRGYAFLKDIFRDLPGMESTELYFSEIGTSVPIRGVVGNNKIIVLLNGMRINPPGGEHLMLRSDLSLRNVDRIEIAYGAGSTLYGEDAISAVVNVVTRKAPESTTADVGLAGGYPGRYELWSSLSRSFGAASLAAHAQYYDANLTDLSRAYPEEWSANYRVWTDPRGGDGGRPVRWDRGFNALARLEIGSSSLQAWHRVSSRSSSEGRWPLLPRSEGAKWTDMSTVVQARHHVPITSQIGTESILTFNRYEILPETRYIFPQSDTEWALWDYKYGLGISAGLEQSFRASIGEKVHATAGVSVAHHDVMPKATIPNGVQRGRDIVSQGISDGGLRYYTERGNPDSVVTVGRVYDIVYQNLAAYAEGSYEILEPLKVIGGIRIDKNTRVHGDPPLSPRLAVRYRLPGSVTAKYIFTQAFVAPPPYFAYSVYQGEDRISVPNDDLRPERASSNELSLSYNGDSVAVGLNAFYNRQRDLLILSDSQRSENILSSEIYFSPDPDAAPQKLVRNANGGKGRVMGGEISLRYALTHVSGWASYSTVDARTETDGIREGLPGISRHNVRGGVTCSPVGQLYLTMGLVLRSTPDLLRRDPATLGTLERASRWPYEIWAHAVYSPEPSVEMFLDIRNMTNRRYALGSSDGPLMPQETFHAMLGFRYRYGSRTGSSPGLEGLSAGPDGRGI